MERPWGCWRNLVQCISLAEVCFQEASFSLCKYQTLRPGCCSPVPSADMSTTLVTRCQAWGMGTSCGKLDVWSLIVEVYFYTNSIPPVLQPLLFDLKSKCVFFPSLAFKVRCKSRFLVSFLVLLVMDMVEFNTPSTLQNILTWQISKPKYGTRQPSKLYAKCWLFLNVYCKIYNIVLFYSRDNS